MNAKRKGGMRVVAVLASLASVLVAPLRSAHASDDETTTRVRLAGATAVLEAQREEGEEREERKEWVEICRSPCRVALTGEDASLPLRVRSAAGIRELGSRPGEDLDIEVADRRGARTALGVTAAVAGA